MWDLWVDRHCGRLSRVLYAGSVAIWCRLYIPTDWQTRVKSCVHSTDKSKIIYKFCSCICLRLRLGRGSGPFSCIRLSVHSFGPRWSKRHGASPWKTDSNKQSLLALETPWKSSEQKTTQLWQPWAWWQLFTSCFISCHLWQGGFFPTVTERCLYIHTKKCFTIGVEASRQRFLQRSGDYA